MKRKLDTFSAEIPEPYKQARKVYGVSGVTTTEAILMALHTHEKMTSKEKRTHMQTVWDKLSTDSDVYGVDLKAHMHPLLSEVTKSFLLNN